MPLSHPDTHASIAANRPYPIFPVPPRSPEASINCITLTSNLFLTLSNPDLILIFFPLLGELFSNDAIISLSSTSVHRVWKSVKCLTFRLTLHGIQTFTCAIIFFLLAYKHSWQDIPEPFYVIGQYGLSWFSCLTKAPMYAQ